MENYFENSPMILNHVRRERKEVRDARRNRFVIARKEIAKRRTAIKNLMLNAFGFNAIEVFVSPRGICDSNLGIRLDDTNCKFRFIAEDVTSWFA